CHRGAAGRTDAGGVACGECHRGPEQAGSQQPGEQSEEDGTAAAATHEKPRKHVHLFFPRESIRVSRSRRIDHRTRAVPAIPTQAVTRNGQLRWHAVAIGWYWNRIALQEEALRWNPGTIRCRRGCSAPDTRSE